MDIVQAKCIGKFKNNKRRIYGYRLIDSNGMTMDVKSEALKDTMACGKIHVINLKLTSDGRLISISEKEQHSDKLANTKVLSKSNKQSSEAIISDLAKAFAYIDHSLIDMGDSYEEIVKNVCCAAGVKEDAWDLDDDKELLKLEAKAYQILINRSDELIVETIQYWLDDEIGNYERIKDSMYAENVDSISKSKTYKAVYTIYKYTKDKNSRLAKEIKKKILDDMQENGVASIRVGKEIGYSYFRYLDSELWGTVSNDVFTVGHAITTDEKKYFKELKPYSYIIRKDFNRLSPKPEIGPAFCFKNGGNGKIIVDIKVFRTGYVSEHSVMVRGYIKNIGTFELDSNNKDNGKIVADYCNKVGKQLDELSHKRKEFLELLPMNEQLEII